MSSDAAESRPNSFRRGGFWRLMTTPLVQLARGRITGRIEVIRGSAPEAGAPAAPPLPPPLLDLTSSVVRKSRLWRSEKADVARELVAHFRDGLDAGADERTLRDSFGDPSSAAKLIRRAKKRNRPLIWHAWVRTAQAIGGLLLVCLLIYAVLAVRYFTARPNIARNFSRELNEKTLAVPEDQRAWPLYREAFMAMPPTPSWMMDANSSAGMSWPYVAFDDPGYAEAERYIAQCAPAMALIREAASRPVFGAIITDADDTELTAAAARRRGGTPPAEPARAASENPTMISILLPHLGTMRQMARDLAFDARAAARRGDGPTAAADLRALAGMASQLGQEPFLISKLVGVAFMAVATEVTRELIEKTPDVFSDAELRGLAHALASDEVRMTSSDLSGEWTFFDDLLQRIYSDDGHGGGHLTAAGMRSLSEFTSDFGISGQATGERIARDLFGPVASVVLAGRKAMKDEWDSMRLEFMEDAARPPWEWEDLPGTRAVERRDSEWWRARYLPINMLLPAMGRSALSLQQTRMTRDAAVVAIAMEIYKRRSGSYPSSLEALVPGLLPNVPTDMFTGEPIRYRLTDKGPLVYSTGTDRDDDAGRLPEGFPEANMQDPRNWKPLGLVGRDGASEGGQTVIPDGDWVLYPIVRRPWTPPPQ